MERHDSFKIPSSTASDSRTLSDATLTDDFFQAELSVPFALVFFSSDGVVVQYCVKIRTPLGVSQISKRFSEIASFDSSIHGNKWYSVLSGGTYRGTLPRLTKSTLSKTNASLKAIGRRRMELDRYFSELSSIVRSHGGRAEEISKVLFPFLKSASVGPASLLPEAYREAFEAETQVLNFFRTETHVTGSKQQLMSQSAAAGSSFTSLSARTSVSSDQLATELHSDDPIFVGLPRSMIFLETEGTPTAVLACDRLERRFDTLTRYHELIAFYKFVMRKDKLPTSEEARSFFVDRQARPATINRPNPRRELNKLKLADAHPARSQSGASSTNDSIDAENPLKGAVAGSIPKGHGDAMALRVGVHPRTRETSNSMHLEAASSENNDDYIAASCCECTDDTLCCRFATQDREPLGQRFVLASGYLLDMRPLSSSRLMPDDRLESAL